MTIRGKASERLTAEESAQLLIKTVDAFFTDPGKRTDDDLKLILFAKARQRGTVRKDFEGYIGTTDDPGSSTGDSAAADTTSEAQGRFSMFRPARGSAEVRPLAP